LGQILQNAGHAQAFLGDSRSVPQHALGVLGEAGDSEQSVDRVRYATISSKPVEGRQYTREAGTIEPPWGPSDAQTTRLGVPRPERNTSPLRRCQLALVVSCRSIASRASLARKPSPSRRASLSSASPVSRRSRSAASRNSARVSGRITGARSRQILQGASHAQALFGDSRSVPQHALGVLGEAGDSE